MATLTMEGKTYEMDLFSDEAIAQVNSLRFDEAELARSNAQIAVFTTAKNGYINARRPHLETFEGAVGSGSKKIRH